MKNNVRIFETMVLYPVHNIADSNKIDEVLLLNSNSDDQFSKWPNCVIAANELLSNSKATSIYITDSVLNLLTIHDKVKNAAAIILNSSEGLNQYVRLIDKYYIIN